MNNPHSLYLILGLFASLSFHLSANDLVQFPTGSSAWTVEITDSPNERKPAGLDVRITKIDVTQNDQFRRNLLTFSDSKTQESWSITGSNLFMSQEPTGAIILKASNKFFSLPYPPSCFDWVRPVFRQEKNPIEYQGKRCFHYKGPMPMPSSFQAKGQMVSGEAWIDSKTKLPVGLDDGRLLATFTFHPTPTTPLELPPGYKQLYEIYKH